MPRTNGGAQRASSSRTVITGPVTRSYPFVSWHPDLDPQPARRLGAVDRPGPNLSQARPFAPAGSLTVASTPRRLSQARPVAAIAPARPTLRRPDRPRQAKRRSSSGARIILVPLIALLVSVTGAAVAPTPTAAATAPLKMVVIVGPSGSVTSRYLSDAEELARTGERHGLDVRRVYHPRATWSKVLANIQGANLVIVFGHGNGWPSEYPPYQTQTKNGLGLNPYEGASAYSTKYYGEGPVSESIDLGTNAIVLLHHMCYTAGNGQTGQAIPSEWIAKQRVDNYGAGFIKSGARAVFAYYWGQQDDFVEQLMTRRATMDQIFMTRGSGSHDGYVGGRDVRFDSVRSKPFDVHMDRSNHGYIRSVVGNLGMTTTVWKSGAGPAPEPEPDPEPDRVAPKLTGLSTGATAPATAGGSAPGIVSPNGDRIRETLQLYHTLSEDAWLDATIRTQDGKIVGKYSKWAKAGRTSHRWDGHDGDGHRFRDGSYVLTMRPRDRAGNRGEPASLAVKVLTAMKSPSLSHEAFFPNDSDGLAAITTLRTKLTRRAYLRFEITDLHGRLIREWEPSHVLEPGNHSWTWRGKDGHGNAAPAGWYRAVTVVRTHAGAESYGQMVYLGAFNVVPADTTPRRGEYLSFTISSTEPLSVDPRIIVNQPGVAEFSVATEATSTPGRYEARVWLREGGSAGMASFRVTGRDIGGRWQGKIIALEID